MVSEIFDNVIKYLGFLIAGDQEQLDAERSAAPQVCADSMNSYAHSGMNRTRDFVAH